MHASATASAEPLAAARPPYVCGFEHCPLHAEQESLKLRTLELEAANAQLALAETAARELARQNLDLLATVSHEIRTPLNAVIGMSRLLLDTALNREQEEYAQTVLLAADALLGVTNNILDYSKVEAGNVCLEQVDFDLVEVIEDAIDLVAVKVWEKRLELTYDIDDGVPRSLRGDPTRLRQVLSNLLGNAVKFTEEGSVHVSVWGGRELGPLLELHFSVKDTGAGIKAEGMGRLFKPYSQADASITRRFGGTGLGLVICERLVKLMWGRIWAESEFGVGSVFYFTVGMRRAGAASRSSFLLAGKTVLIVDSDPAHLSQQAWRCRHFGMKVTTAASAADALARLGNGVVDVILMDSDIAGMPAARLAREMRNLAGAARIPIILAATGSLADAEPAGDQFQARLLKPMRTRVLARTLEDLLGAGGRPPAAAAAPLSDGHHAPALLRPCVLVADDNVTNRKLMLMMLAKLGVAADSAENGLEVLEALRRKRYDLIFMDMHMPQMDGIEATREIIRRMGAARPRIVAATANTSQNDRDLCLEAGMDDYLSKPIMPETLRRVIDASTVPGCEQKAAHDGHEVTCLDSEMIDTLREVFRGEPEKLGELLKEFINEAAARAEMIFVAAQAQDFATIIAVAHKLKGSAAVVGAKELARVAYRLQCAGLNNDPGVIDNLTQELQRVLPATREALRSLIADTAAAAPAGDK